MKTDRLFQPSVIICVSLLHIALIAAGWQAAKLPDPVMAGNLTFIDLGSPDGDGQPKAEGAPAPISNASESTSKTVQAAEPPKPKPKETVKQPPASPVKTVIRHDVKPDIAAPKLQATQPQQTAETPTRNRPPDIQAEKTTQTSAAPSAQSQSSAAKHSNDAPANGGGGNNPNSKAAGNGSGASQEGSGTGNKGSGGGHSGGGANTIVDGGYITLPMPPYPPLALENGEEGHVRIEIIVETNGRISSAKIIKGSGSHRLDNAALRAAKGANIRPKTVNGEPVRSRFITPFDFKL